MTSTVPPGQGPLRITTQALRAWLLSGCPAGTKAIRPSMIETIEVETIDLSPIEISAIPVCL